MSGGCRCCGSSMAIPKFDQPGFGPKRGAQGSDSDAPLFRPRCRLRTEPEQWNIVQIRTLDVLSRAKLRLIELRTGHDNPHNRYPIDSEFPPGHTQITSLNQRFRIILAPPQPGGPNLSPRGTIGRSGPNSVAIRPNFSDPDQMLVALRSTCSDVV